MTWQILVSKGVVEKDQLDEMSTKNWCDERLTHSLICTKCLTFSMYLTAQTAASQMLQFLSKCQKNTTQSFSYNICSKELSSSNVTFENYISSLKLTKIPNQLVSVLHVHKSLQIKIPPFVKMVIALAPYVSCPSGWMTLSHHLIYTPLNISWLTSHLRCRYTVPCISAVHTKEDWLGTSYQTE